MVLHGCGQSVGMIGTRFIEYSGYNDVAESNDIIILYPQVLNTTTNPDACWDFKGYTGNDYLTKEGVQTKALNSILYKIEKDGIDFKSANIGGPVNMTSAEACMNCGPGSEWTKKVCSIDGNAWCCDRKSSHPLCACPGEFADYVYCPSSAACGPSLFNFTDTTEEIVANATIDQNFTNDLCIYELATDRERVVNIFTNERLTVYDPEYTR